MSEPPGLTEIRFGTDGWRAVIAEGFTFSNLERVAQAYSNYLQKQQAATKSSTDETGNTPPALVIIGYDRRFLSEHFALRASEIMAGNGFRVALFTEAAPTPLEDR